MSPLKKILVLAIAPAAILAIGYLYAAPQAAKKSPYAAWNGRWEGEFTVYTADGKVENRLKVIQTYTEVNASEQRAIFEEVDQNGKRMTAKASNIVRDGVLLCEVKKSDGSISKHTGRKLEDGGLCWYGKTADKQECFMERVVKEKDGTYYRINGFGIYGADRKNTYYFEGKYKKVKAPK